MEKKTITAAQEFNEESFSKINVFEEENSTLFVINFLPGQQMPEHNHPGRELYLHVIKGSGRFIIDGAAIGVTEDDVIHIGPEEKISFVNDSEDRASIYVTMSRIHQ
ncbi:cupin domain-containing protein [Salinicoccus sp. HZC-1]|uniref:cupin domain-containing protein n=1 Tax=Salinicoccus sp. HZC-1 TaxID=3385497 RepID=UPI00398AC21A